ncbi:hypothetical protein NOS3756_59340 (plasmid) [Nostoc sp. NIES-3756]|uniref:CHAT domain-containing protein n=1 Tax=Nostoc sp. NIES-3756 TaxID=1751286 RepID=UPI0007216577|nr:CHAT domain-containing protein [Nostoc sp. NIES-3756]BAT56922.1 hypothetical protein NOS3756_59340 [Nostoc sp. NIES-3756]
MHQVNYLTIILLITGIIVPVSAQTETIHVVQTPRNIRFKPPKAQLSVKSDVIAVQEESWKKDYEKYLEYDFNQAIMGANSVRKVLQKITNETGKKSAVVYLIPGESELEIILVKSNQEPIRKTISAANRQNLIKVVKKFQSEINDIKQVDNQNYLADAQQLYQWLIAPIAQDLQAENIDTLLFCVGVGLRSLPFSALHDGKQFLVEKYSTSLIPAFSLTNTRYTDIRNSPVLAMGASQFQNLEPLPSVPVELSTIVQNKGGSNFLNDKFTVDNLRSQRQQQFYKIVHLATHGVFTSGAVSNSYIQFWNTRVRLNQLRNLQLNTPPVDLLVLSACQTALGDEEAELGFSGLALEAGAKSAIGSLWSVSDVGTLALMTEFYSQLNTLPIKADALRQAQIIMLHKQIQIRQGQLQQLRSSRKIPLPPEMAKIGDFDLSHPYYWAAFTMIGSPW